MKFPSLVNSKVTTIVAAGLVAATVGAGASVAADKITTTQIKNGTIQTQDLTKNNFARFTATENVVAASTATSTNPAYGTQRVVDVAAQGTTGLVTLTLDKGTWKIEGSAQFWHIGPAAVAEPDYGVVTVPGLQSGYATSFTSDVPNGGINPAQVAISGTIRIVANNTPVVISGNFTGGNSGQAGAQVTATQYVYVKQFKNGQPL